MKMLKRLGAIAIAAVMLAAVGGIPAAAASTQPATGSITINDKSGGNYQYSAYRITGFDVTNDAAGKTVFTNFKMDQANGAVYRSVLISTLGLTGSPSDNDIFKAVSGLDADGTEALAIKLRDASSKATMTSQFQSGKFSNLPIGYYLLLETGITKEDGSTFSKPMLVSVPDKSGSYDVTINVKNSKAGIEKKIREHDSSGNPILVDSSTAAIGDTVNYQSLADIPAYPKDKENITYFVTDTFCDALDFNPNSVGAQIVDNSDPKNVKLIKSLSTTDYTLDSKYADSVNKEKGFKLTLNSSDNIRVWGNAGYKLLVTYSAKLNSSANTGKTGNPNTTYLTYSIKPGKDDTSYQTPNDTVITYTYKLVVTKKDGDKLLNGAVFELQDFKGNKIGSDVTTGTDGTATFTQLQQGSYKLVETAAPAGYNLCDPITFTVGATNDGDGSLIPNDKFTFSVKDNEDAIAKIFATWSSKLTSQSSATLTDGKAELDAVVQDTPGFVLPGTGGIGTTIFTVSGIAILLIGGLLALLYYKKSKESRQQ